MKKTLVYQLQKYLEQNQGFVSGAALSRLVWPKYAYGEKRGEHSPRSVIRRLEELVEDEEILVEYRKGQAFYAAKIHRPKQVVEIINGKPTLVTV